MSVLTSFKAEVEKELTSKGLEVGLWRGAIRRSANLLVISTKPQPTVLYVRQSNSLPGFWGLTKNQLNRLNKAQVRWFTVLLARSNDNGYIFSSEEVKQRVQDGTFKLSQDGDHKVNERTDLNPNIAFRGIKELLARILK